MREKTCVWGDGDQSEFLGQLCYTAIMPRRRKSRRPILERFMPIRASDFCNENLGDYFCDYPPPFAWPFMQKLRASRARVWFEHKTSGLLHKLGFQWTRCNFGGRRPWLVSGGVFPFGIETPMAAAAFFGPSCPILASPGNWRVFLSVWKTRACI